LKDRCKIFAPQNSFKPVGLEPFPSRKERGKGTHWSLALDAQKQPPDEEPVTSSAPQLTAKANFKLAFGRLDNFKE
jgi:hypothetical protein